MCSGDNDVNDKRWAHIATWRDGNVCCISGPSWGWSLGHRCITFKRGRNSELWRSCDVSNTLLNKHSKCRWFEKPKCSCYVIVMRDQFRATHRNIYYTLNHNHTSLVLKWNWFLFWSKCHILCVYAVYRAAVWNADICLFVLELVGEGVRMNSLRSSDAYMRR